MRNQKRAAENLVSAIAQRTKDGTPCFGRYCIRIRGTPRIPKPTSAEGRRVIEHARLFIGVTGSVARVGPEKLLIDEAGEILIEKLGREYAGGVILKVVTSG